MGVNRDRPDRWKEDIAASVDMYNEWFMNFAPKAFRETRIHTTIDVEQALLLTKNLEGITVRVLQEHPEILPSLRMSTCPPLAVDRLIGLAGITPGLVKSMEGKNQIPPRMKREPLVEGLNKIAKIIQRMTDPDIFVWIERDKPATRTEVHRAATIVADRLCGSVANPIIRNAQEKRQLASIKDWLSNHGYEMITTSDGIKFDSMQPGTFSFRTTIPVNLADKEHSVNIPVDAVVMPKTAVSDDLPVFIEAKSAGDFANTNKRRKEEAVKVTQLRATYGESVKFNLFLCGYFDSGYLGYEAAEGIDWVWEHRIDDLEQLGF